MNSVFIFTGEIQAHFRCFAVFVTTNGTNRNVILPKASRALNHLSRGHIPTLTTRSRFRGLFFNDSFLVRSIVTFPIIAFRLVAVPQDLLPTGKWDFPMGSLCFECNLYSHSETAHGKSLWIHQKEQKNYPWRFPNQVVGFSLGWPSHKSSLTNRVEGKVKFLRGFIYFNTSLHWDLFPRTLQRAKNFFPYNHCLLLSVKWQPLFTFKHLNGNNFRKNFRFPLRTLLEFSVYEKILLSTSSFFTKGLQAPLQYFSFFFSAGLDTVVSGKGLVPD